MQMSGGSSATANAIDSAGIKWRGPAWATNASTRLRNLPALYAEDLGWSYPPTNMPDTTWGMGHPILAMQLQNLTPDVQIYRY